jgi:hypothetical protein
MENRARFYFGGHAILGPAANAVVNPTDLPMRRDGTPENRTDTVHLLPVVISPHRFQR